MWPAGIPLDVTICHADVREMSRNLTGKNPERQAEIFAGLVGRMKAAGAAGRRHHLDGRPFLRQRAHGDFAACRSSTPFPTSMPLSREGS